MTFRKALLITFFLTGLFLVVFIVRQVLMSAGLAATETDLAADMIRDFLSSRGAVLDLLYFIFSLVVLHAFFAVLAAILTFSVVRPGQSRGKEYVFAVLAFFFLVLTVLIWDSIYYPVTMAGFLRFSPLSSYNVALVLSVLAGIGLLIGSVRLYKSGHRFVTTVTMTVLAFVTGASLYSWSGSSCSASSARAQTGSPNIIVIGVDALRPDHLGINGFKPDLTPNIDQFLASSEIFTQAFTPIARTYTAWFALLSGRSPVHSGVRYNLQKFSPNQLTGNELQYVLKKKGYHTIYGLDERRFNNIDERYGFDETVGPKIGAADFLLFHASELPLVSLVANSPVAKVMFPFIYENRGVHATYIPETFTRDVLNTVDNAPADKPLFLSVHLTLTHWPYMYRKFEPIEGVKFDPENRFHYLYQMAMKKADTQFGKLMKGLNELGATDNALIFVISDHGESFMLQSDQLKNGVEGLDFPTDAHGHGTTVLSQAQYHVVLGMKDTGRKQAKPGRSDTMVSLLDIAPTVADYLGLEASALGYEGRSLFQLENCSGCSDREIFLESSVSTNAMFEKDLDMVRVMAEGIGFYTVDNDGLAVVRPEVTKMLALKQRAVINKDYLVAHFPGLEQDFIVVSRKKNTWWPSTQFGGDDPGEVLSMMRDLCLYYKNDTSFDSQGLCKNAY